MKKLSIEAKHWLYPSNLITLFRFALALPEYVALVRHRYEYALAVLFLIAVTDAIDGYLARRFNQITELGKILDPLADRFALLAAMVGLVVSGSLPAWTLVPVLLRDSILLPASLLFIRRRAIVPSSNLWGKLTTHSFVAVVGFHLLPVPDLVRTISIVVMLILLVISTVSYGRLFLRSLRAVKP